MHTYKCQRGARVNQASCETDANGAATGVLNRLHYCNGNLYGFFCLPLSQQAAFTTAVSQSTSSAIAASAVTAVTAVAGSGGDEVGDSGSGN